MARATAPVVAVALLVALTVCLASVASVTSLALDAPDDPVTASISLSVDATEDRLAFTHSGGDALDVRRLEVTVTVDGDRLTHPPPVPFFAAEGFESGPTGPFNRGADPTWTAGETATLSLASTNEPAIENRSRVRATVRHDGHLVARPTARPG